MNVEITDLSHVYVDGKPAGSVVDAITNAPDCKAAVMDWLNARDKEAEIKSCHALTKLQEAMSREKEAGGGPRLDVLVELEAAINMDAKEILREQAQQRFDAAKAALEALSPLQAKEEIK